jgi:hypothetical protein
VSLNQPDLDLLADYVGGALDGTPDEQRVDERIRTDAEWAQAYADLVAAFDAVSGDLRAFGSTPEPMPADVWDRLEAALSSASTTPDSPPFRDSLPKAPPVFTAPKDNRPPGRSTRRRRRLDTPVLAAVAVLFVLMAGIFAIKGLPRLDGGKNIGTSGADAPAPATAGPPIYQRASGRDYTQDNLVLATDFGSVAMSSSTGADSSLPDKSASNGYSASYATPIPSALVPLTSAERLAACLNALTAMTPGQVIGVDYATFRRDPAAVFVVRTPDDGRSVAVVGADCGVRGADLILQKRLS